MENQKYFQVEDTVYSQTFGQGEVTSITNGGRFPIIVWFKKPEMEFSFTFDGRYGNHCPIGLSKVPLPEITNGPLLEFQLSFHEAMVELYGNSRKVQAESHQYMIFDLDNEGQLVMESNNSINKCCSFNQDMYLSYWRVVE